MTGLNMMAVRNTCSVRGGGVLNSCSARDDRTSAGHHIRFSLKSHSHPPNTGEGGAATFWVRLHRPGSETQGPSTALRLAALDVVPLGMTGVQATGDWGELQDNSRGAGRL